MITMKARLWIYPGSSPWHFLSIPKSHSNKIRRQYSHLKHGFGSLKVTVTLGRTTWNTSIFPDSKTGTYLLPVKSHVRRSECLKAGQVVTFNLAIKEPS